MLYAGDTKGARAAFEKVHAASPDLKCFEDGALSAQAIHVCNALRPRLGAEVAKKAARGLLEMGVELNGGQAPNCAFALRFYQ